MTKEIQRNDEWTTDGNEEKRWTRKWRKWHIMKNSANWRKIMNNRMEKYSEQKKEVTQFNNLLRQQKKANEQQNEVTNDNEE